MKQKKMIGRKVRRIVVSFAAALAAMFATSAAMAAVSNLESYHFRFDFSKGTANFIPSAEVAAASPNTVTNFVGSNVTPVEGPNGPGNAVHITSSAWQPFESQSILNADWTLAMTFRPGTVEGGTIISLGRIPNTGASAVAICSSSDTSKLYATVVTRNDKGYALEKKQELTGLGDVTQGYHTLVVAYKYAASNKGTLYFYWDGVPKGSYTLTTGYSFGSDSSKSGMQFNQLVTRGATAVGGFTHQTVSNNSDYSLYDVRLYPGQFSDADATAYAALYPADRMGSPFRPNAYVEANGTNTASAGVGNYIDTGYLAKGERTRFAADYQYLDVLGQQRIFGARGDFVQGLYINGTAATGGKLAWSFMGPTKWVNMNVDAERLRQIAMFDRVGKTIAVTNYAARTQFYYTNNQTEFLKTTSDASANTYLFAENNSGAKSFGKARIYSFEADEQGTPVLFLAPDMENGEAGFRNIIDGSFKGDGNKDNNQVRKLQFYNGVGCASDYKYENDTLYAKLYATSDGNGTVSVAEGAAAASAEGWIPHGGTLALEAVPAANMEFKEWIGDTWVIVDGYSVSNASIEVSTPYAVQLQATFKPAVNALLTIAADGASAVNWSEADWRNIDNSEETITAPEDKNVTIVAHKSFTLTLDMDVALSNLTVQADANCVVTLMNSVGSLVTVETIVESGVLKQGTAGVLGTTPKLTVRDGGTFDVNRVKIETATKLYIAGSGAGNWPWAVCSSSGSMASGNYFADITLLADATIGGSGQLKIGAGETSANKIVLNNHKLTLAGTKSATFRNLNTGAGTVELAPGYIITLNKWNNLNSDKDNYSGTTLIIRNGARVVNQTDRVIYAATVQLDGGDIWAGGDDKKAFGPLSTLSGHGMIHKLVMPEGAAYKPDGLDYLNVTTSLSGTVAVDLSGIDFTTRTTPIPLLEVPTALADTARSSLDLTVPTGWKLNEKSDGGNVTFTLRKPKGVMIIVY